MLSRPFERTFVPGRPAAPEIPAREAYTYCTTPAGYTTVRICVPPNTYYSASLGAVVTVPGYCYTERRPNPGPQEVVCTDVPAQEYVPADPGSRPRFETAPRVGWDAGAVSVQSHAGSCEAKWIMGVVAGAYIGLTHERETVIDTTLLTHAFLFHQKSGVPHFRIVEAGRSVSQDIRYQNGDEFAIRRAGAQVQYVRNGDVIQDSYLPSEGVVSVGTRLYSSGDQVPTSVVGAGPEPDPDFNGLSYSGTVPPIFLSPPSVIPPGFYHAYESYGDANIICGVLNNESMEAIVLFEGGGSASFELSETTEIVLGVDALSGGPYAFQINLEMPE